MPLPIPYNTGLTEEQIAEVFRRAINDMTDEQITALLAEKVDKQEGFSLMSAADKSKLDDLENYDDADVKEKIDAIINQIFGLGTQIPNGADLNDYTQAGVYYAETSTKVGTLLNVPYKQAGFRLEIYYQTNNQRFIQKLFPNTASGVFFYRVYASGGFSSWYKFTGEAVTT